MTPPDSDPREVCNVWDSAPSICVRKRPCAVHGNSFRAQIAVPLSLAQRILAALESMQNHASGSAFRALAAELRALLVTK